MLLGGLDDLDEPDLSGLAVGQLVARPLRVLEAQLEGIHLELAGQLVERRFEDEEGLGAAGSAIGVDRRLVGRDLVGRVGHVGNQVGAVEEHSGDVPVPARGGAVVPDHRDLHRGQGAVAPCAELDVGVAGGCRPADQELLAPRQCDLDGLAQPLGKQRGEGLEEHDLAAEASADGHRNHPHLGGRQLEHLGDLVADEAMALGGAPDRDHASRLGSGDSHVWLDEALVGARHHVAALHPDLRLGQAGRDVAALLAGD